MSPFPPGHSAPVLAAVKAGPAGSLRLALTTAAVQRLITSGGNSPKGKTHNTTRSASRENRVSTKPGAVHFTFTGATATGCHSTTWSPLARPPPPAGPHTRALPPARLEPDGQATACTGVTSIPAGATGGSDPTADPVADGPAVR